MKMKYGEMSSQKVPKPSVSALSLKLRNAVLVTSLLTAFGIGGSKAADAVKPADAGNQNMAAQTVVDTGETVTITIKGEKRELKKISVRKTVYKTYDEITLDFIKHKKEKQELAQYLNSVGAKTSIIHEIIKPGGRYDTIYKVYWNKYVTIGAEEIRGAFYRGDEKNVEQYLRLIKEHLEFIKTVGLTERDVFEALRKTEDGKKMSDAQLRKLITVAVRVGFDRTTALEMLREWGVVPPTLLDASESNTGTDD